MNFRHVARAVLNQPWAILEDRLLAIVGVLEFRMKGEHHSPEEIRDAIGAASSEHTPYFALENGERMAFEAAAPVPQLPAGTKAVAVLPLMGIIQQRANLLSDVSGPGATSTEMFGRRFREALNSPNVKAIVIEVDSPGGGVFGVEELASEIYKARGQKKVVAVANSLAASAAYWIASAADQFVVTPGGLVGSIGVYAEHVDMTKYEEAQGLKVTLISAGKYKTEGHPSQPLSDEALAATQRDVDAYYSMFTKAVARHRGVSQAAVIGGFGEGRTVMAEEAKQLGMVDRVATLDRVLHDLGVGGVQRVAAASHDAAIAAEAVANVEADLSAAPDPDAVMRDLELRRKLIELAAI